MPHWGLLGAPHPWSVQAPRDWSDPQTCPGAASVTSPSLDSVVGVLGHPLCLVEGFHGAVFSKNPLVESSGEGGVMIAALGAVQETLG